jgi:DNA mismatch repair protein MutL
VGPAAHPHHGLPGRGPAVDRLGGPAVDQPPAPRASRDAWSILVEGGSVGDVAPAAFAGDHGARIEVRDLFYATPARLKFMKSERAEALAITEEIKRQAMANESVGFSLDIDGRRIMRLPPEHPGPQGRLARLSAVLGRDFHDNAIEIDQTRDGVRLTGFAGLPTYNRGNAAHQYLFVNGRPVRDRLLQGALRAAYADFLARDRHPTAALYISLDTAEVDVNVHPAKAEVRFRDPALVRGLIVGALRHALAAAGHRASTTTAARARWTSIRAQRWPRPPIQATSPTRPLARRLLGLAVGRLDAARAPGAAGPVGRLGPL